MMNSSHPSDPYDPSPFMPFSGSQKYQLSDWDSTHSFLLDSIPLPFYFPPPPPPPPQLPAAIIPTDYPRPAGGSSNSRTGLRWPPASAGREAIVSGSTLDIELTSPTTTIICCYLAGRRITSRLGARRRGARLTSPELSTITAGTRCAISIPKPPSSSSRAGFSSASANSAADFIGLPNSTRRNEAAGSAWRSTIVGGGSCSLNPQ
ncbi:hypothetical protein KSP39_PZI001668 [Platanthera zijinensis]|uniref:Uncharacterized protein n=1 Tax=Platanthera zijinensis TaxID=2320716 RepID=A0AAP0BX94_9ASPA